MVNKQLYHFNRDKDNKYYHNSNVPLIICYELNFFSYFCVVGSCTVIYYTISISIYAINNKLLGSQLYMY